MSRSGALGLTGCLALASLASVSHYGCAGHKKPAPLLPAAPVATSAPTPAAPPPQEATEGRLVAAHVDVLGGIGVYPPEPFAPRGQWRLSPAGAWVWVPDYVERGGFTSALLAQVDGTEPEADSRIPAGTKGAKPGTRVIVCDPGGFSYAVQDGPSSSSGTLLARGLTAFGAWQERTELPGADVIWVSWRMSQWEGPERLIPAYAHELRHSILQDRLGE